MFCFLLLGTLGCKKEPGAQTPVVDTPPPPPPPRFVGYYEADAGSENLAGPLLSLSLMPDKGAELITDSMNYKPELVEVGDWESLGKGKIDVYLTSVGSNQQREIHLEMIGDNLVWTGSGNDLVFRPADQVVGRIRELIMWVGPDKVDCMGDGPMRCFQVSYGDTQSPGELENFYDPIEGFLWHPGTAYKIKVKETYKGENSVDASSIKYELVEILLQQSLN